MWAVVWCEGVSFGWMWEVFLEWWQAYVLLVDGGLARCGKGSTELSREKDEISRPCAWLQRAMMNGVLARFFFPPSLVSIKSSQSVILLRW